MNLTIFTKSITFKLILSIIISLFFSFLSVFVFSGFIAQPYIIARAGSLSILEYNIIAIFIFTIGIASFLVTFLLLVNSKVKYIKYISENVNKIANEKLGSTLIVRGNDELAELCKNINYMSLQLKNKFDHEREIENSKSELITNISHDLRTPLTAIIGYLDILKNKKYKDENEKNEYINSTYNLSIKLKSLIDELFEFTMLSNNSIELKLEEVNLSSILLQILGEYTPIFEDKTLGVISHIDEEIPAKIDVEKMVRVFDNILSNAEKYSVKPSDIIVEARGQLDYIYIAISNKSEHIEQNKLNKIFEKFYRGDISRSNKIEGSGLGLAISKRIIELHNGQIWAESHEDIITIYIKLPISHK